MKTIKREYPYLVLICILMFAVPVSGADIPRTGIPDRYGVTVTGGRSYDPTRNISFIQVSAFALFDHERVFPHRAPEPLRVKFEAILGGMTSPKTRAIASAHIFSVYYLDVLATKSLKPYIEGGIGGIYTDYRWKGQGTRFNFNPQLGIGTEIKTPSGDYLTSARLFHVSNAGFNGRNRGLNAVTISLGRFF